MTTCELKDTLAPSTGRNPDGSTGESQAGHGERGGARSRVVVAAWVPLLPHPSLGPGPRTPILDQSSERESEKVGRRRLAEDALSSQPPASRGSRLGPASLVRPASPTTYPGGPTPPLLPGDPASLGVPPPPCLGEVPTPPRFPENSAWGGSCLRSAPGLSRLVGSASAPSSPQCLVLLTPPGNPHNCPSRRR